MIYKSLNPNAKEKISENIKDYSHFSHLFIMTKIKSPCSILFCSNKNDPYLIYVIKYKTKTGNISDYSIVLEPDIPRWIEIYQNEGFTK